MLIAINKQETSAHNLGGSMFIWRTHAIVENTEASESVEYQEFSYRLKCLFPINEELIQEIKFWMDFDKLLYLK